MARMIGHFAIALTIPIGILQLVATFFVPLHLVTIMIGPSIGLRIRMRAAGADVEVGDLCSLLLKAKPDLKFCNDIGGGHDLMDLQQRFCVDLVDTMFTNACGGFSCAYAIGVGMVIMVVTNFCLEGTAVWMLYYYNYNTPKKQFREISLILVIVGASLVAICLGLYCPLVSLQLDSMEIRIPGINMIVNISPGTGIYMGYWLLWVSVILQVLQIVLFKNSKISDERRRVEAKMQEQFEAELAIGGWDEYGADPYAAGGYGGGGYDPYAVPVQPYAPQAPPSWGVTPYPMQPAYGGQPGYGSYPGY